MAKFVDPSLVLNATSVVNDAMDLWSTQYVSLVRWFLARQHASTPQVARWQLVRYSIHIGKGRVGRFLGMLAFPSGGASKPHRSKYIVIGSSFQQLPRS